MNAAEIIQKKRDGKILDSKEIEFFIQGLLKGDIADYQATALLMAIFFRNLNAKETLALTQTMLNSGSQYSFKSISGPKIDKHSTGGVGDKVSLILAPLGAACGLRIPMMSGRSLGHTGGTLDKLDAIPGFKHSLSRGEFEDVLQNVGCSMIGQDESIAPADKILYSLRDVTATVDCIPLIVSSILSKKVAEGTEGLVLDIKVGSGAFMKMKKEARLLAKTLVQVGKKLGLKTKAVLTDMNQPLGYSIGNSLEVIEAIEVLQNKKSEVNGMSSCDLKEVTIHLCAQMLLLAKKAKSLNDGRKTAMQKLQNGEAWEKFKLLVQAQGGDLHSIEDPSRLPISHNCVQWKSRRRGYLNAINTETIGKIVVSLGGGRLKTSDPVDPSVGLVFHKKLGARLKPGDPIATVYAPGDTAPSSDLEARFLNALQIQSTRKPRPKLIIETYS